MDWESYTSEPILQSAQGFLSVPVSLELSLLARYRMEERRTEDIMAEKKEGVPERDICSTICHFNNSSLENGNNGCNS